LNRSKTDLRSAAIHAGEVVTMRGCSGCREHRRSSHGDKGISSRKFRDSNGVVFVPTCVSLLTHNLKRPTQDKRTICASDSMNYPASLSTAFSHLGIVVF